MNRSRDDKDVRWKQRFQNFCAAFSQLENAVQQSHIRTLSDLENQGLIQAFEFTHELAWNTLRDYFIDQGSNDLITGSRDASREAFNKGLIEDGDTWMEMIKSRNLTSHTYNLKVSQEIVQKIKSQYYPAFIQFRDRMTERLSHG
jgi:nucleotidyltransferase substrate binding protein (TIGR01987 family)